MNKEWNYKKRISYRKIWEIGQEISNGSGFWGNLNRFYNVKKIVKAWVDGLREKGLSDIDIILYGDWKDGRHISDNFTNETGYIEAKNFIKSIDRDIEFIKKENMKEYLEDTEFIESCPKFINTFKR